MVKKNKEHKLDKEALTMSMKPENKKQAHELELL